MTFNNKSEKIIIINHLCVINFILKLSNIKFSLLKETEYKQFGTFENQIGLLCDFYPQPLDI